MSLQSITKDFFLKLACVAFSIMLWLYVESQAPVATDDRTFTFTLVEEGLPEDLIITRIVPREVQLTATGTPEEIARIDPKSLRAVVDLSNAEPGEPREYDVRRAEVRGANVRWSVPQDVLVEVESKTTLMQTVTLSVTNLPPGQALGTYEIDPDRVELEGPESEIKQVATVSALLDLKGEYEVGREYPLTVEALAANGKPLTKVTSSPARVYVRPVLVPANAGKRLLVSPMWSGQPPAGYTISRVVVDPPAVVAAGGDKLQSLHNVNTRPIRLTNKAGTFTETVRLNMPAGVQVTPSSVRITVEMQKLPEPAKPTSPAPKTDTAPTTTPNGEPPSESTGRESSG